MSEDNTKASDSAARDTSGDGNPTVFGAILRGELPSNRVWEDEHCIAFHDINPIASTHLLIIPRAYIPTLSDVKREDAPLMGHMMWVAGEIARKMGFDDDGYRLIINCREGGGQVVFHLHMHIISGKDPKWPIGEKIH